MINETERGRLNAYDPIKGVGFIRREKGRDVFVHYSDFIDEEGDAGAILGTIVEFELEVPQNPKGPRARNVRIIG